MRYLFTVIFIIVPFSTVAGSLDGCVEHIKYGAPSLNQTDDHLCRLGYALAHNKTKKVPIWVAYHLTAEKINGTHPRSNDFRSDPDLDENERSELADYDGSGFARGHMAPAAAMKWSAKAMSESFLLSNMAPQVHNGFNNGIWSTLESRVRSWVKERGQLYVVSGNIFESEIHPSLPPNNVVVPSHCFKLIFDPVVVEAIAFILPNEKNSSSKLTTFIVSVDEVESKTGLDFLNKLEDSVEDVVESHIAPEMWRY